MRHLWQECPFFVGLREELQLSHSIPSAWWAAQPRVTSKSGWIVRQADPSLADRVRRQIAAAILGVRIVAATPSERLALHD